MTKAFSLLQKKTISYLRLVKNFHPPVITIMLLIASILPVDAQDIALSPRIANYDMHITLDDQEKVLRGNTKLLWKNPGSSTVSELQFHLYYNAFKNSESTFLKESGEIPDFFVETLIEDCGWSYSEITEMQTRSGTDLMPGMAYIQPDDNNPNDQTVLQVLLPDSVLPGDSIEIDFNWTAKIPKAMIRTGWNKDYYFFAQWFPKLGVYETAGTRYATEDQWNCHQYHANGEYYADFGNYRVTMNVPSDFVIGSSGSLTNKSETDNRTEWTFEVNDVIDFTWTASPHFIVQNDTWNHVELSLLTYPGHEHFADRYFETVKNTFEYLDRHLGPYPYSTLTMVDPPIHGIFTGGMEYPTLISSLSLSFLPRGFKSTETLVVHEFIHQYFMQMVATHEQEEPWMDEGITTYYEGRILDHYYGENTSFVNLMGMRIGSSEYNRGEFFAMDNPKIAAQSNKARDYKHGGYGPIAYNKTALWLKTLEGIIGRETFDVAMKTYFETWKFKHPNRDDFISIFNDVNKLKNGDRFGDDLNWFFDQVIFGTEICDYAVSNISNLPITNPIGILDELDDCVQPETNKEEAQFQSQVILERRGELILPQEILVTFENGKSKLEYWDGKSRSHEFRYTSDSPITSVEIDPNKKIWLDKDWINNSETVKANRVGIRKYWFKAMASAQSLMESLNLLM